MPRIRLNPGTVFAFPVAGEQFGAGQIIRPKPLLLAVIFRDLLRQPLPPVDEIVSTPPAFVVTTFDVLIKRGDWKVLGEAQPITLPELVFKVSRSTIDNIFLEDLDRTKGRPATREEIQHVPYRSSVSPKGVEAMLEALHGMRDWQAEYDGYTWEAITDRSKLLA